MEILQDLSEWLNNNLLQIREAPDGRIYEIKQLVRNSENLNIQIRFKEHPPPHFHLIHGSDTASFQIEKDGLLKKLEGNVDRKIEKKIKYLYEYGHFRHKLIKTWNDTRPTDCPVGPIA